MGCVRSGVHPAGDHCTRGDVWRFALGQCSQSLGECFYHHRLSFERHCGRFFKKKSSHSTGRFFPQSSAKSPFLQLGSGAAQSTRVIGSCLVLQAPQFNFLTRLFNFQKSASQGKAGLKCLGSRII